MGLSLVDRCWLRAFDIYRYACGFRAQIVETEAEGNECRAFALKVFSDAGLLDNVQAAKPLPDKGCHSTIGVVRHKGEIVGMVDVVRAEGRFPVQYFFHVALPEGVPQDEIAEIARLAVHRDFRKRNSTVSIALLALALRQADRDGVKYWIMCSPALLRQGFRAFFGKLTVIPEKEVQPLQEQYRKHRESYFSPSLGVQVYSIPIEDFSVWAAAKELFRRRWARSKWKKKPRTTQSKKSASDL